MCVWVPREAETRREWRSPGGDVGQRVPRRGTDVLINDLLAAGEIDRRFTLDLWLRCSVSARYLVISLGSARDGDIEGSCLCARKARLRATGTTQLVWTRMSRLRHRLVK